MKRVVRHKPQRGGFILLEVLVAMVLLALVLSSLAGMMFAVSRRAITSTGFAYRNAVLMQEVNRLEALPFDSLSVGSASVTVAEKPYAHTRVVSVTSSSNNAKLVTVVITPANALYKADTVSFTRTRPATSTALTSNTGV